MLVARDRRRGAARRGRSGRGRAAAMRPVRAGDVPRPGADAAAGARHRPRRARRHDRRVRPRTCRRSTPRRPRVVSGLAGASVQGRDLRYAIVGDPDRVTPRGPRARARRGREADGPAHAGRATRRRSPRATPRSCGSPATSTAARRAAPTRRCACSTSSPTAPTARRTQILDNAIVVILPIAEPGRPRGRHAPQRLRLRHEPRLVRAHAAGDRRQARAAAPAARRCCSSTRTRWAARTTTSSRRTPTRSTTRSPTSRSTGSTTSTAPAIAGRVRRAHDPATSTTTSYDLFYMGYGDTVPATGFGAAGMTFEKSSGDPPSRARVRAVPHRSGRRSSRPPRNKRRDPRAAGTTRWVEAERAGRAPATLEPNEVVQPEQRGRSSPVPDITVAPLLPAPTTRPRRARRSARPAAAADGRARCDRLTQPLAVPRLHARTAAPRASDDAAGRAPTGSRWTSAQKHWVQAMLNEDTVRAVPVLLRRHGAGASRCCSTSRAATRARRLHDAPTRGAARCRSGRAGAAGRRAADRAVLDVAAVRRAGSSPSGWLRWLLDRWGLRVRAT